MVAFLAGCGNGGGDESGSTASASLPTSESKQALSNDGGTQEGAHLDPVPGGEVQGHPQPPTPEVEVTKQSKTVVIRFRFPPVRDGEAEPWMLLTSIDAAGERISPLTLRTPVTGKDAGVIRQPLGLGRPPFELLVSTQAANGLRSEIVSLPLPR